ncbi:hypothetical protein ABT288_35850 [Streptomyces sp. NPDC001093]|uniref:hypothetical protein n=1 Tax=Streptomyces sp. NPDC001093 TaxID=3154376 RepID=UPI0033176453
MAGADVSPSALHYARSRAPDLAVAAQHQTRFDAYVLDALRGVDPDGVTAAV